MSEIEITLPTVQYGNVKVRATPEELGLSSVADADVLGTAAAIYLNLFRQGFEVGAKMDVSAPVGYDHKVAEQQARELLNEGLGGVTEIDGQDPEGPGEEPSAPWGKPQVDSKPKPWETGGTTPATKPVIGEDW